MIAITPAPITPTLVVNADLHPFWPTWWRTRQCAELRDTPIDFAPQSTGSMVSSARLLDTPNGVELAWAWYTQDSSQIAAPPPVRPNRPLPRPLGKDDMRDDVVEERHEKQRPTWHVRAATLGRDGRLGVPAVRPFETMGYQLAGDRAWYSTYDGFTSAMHVCGAGQAPPCPKRDKIPWQPPSLTGYYLNGALFAWNAARNEFGVAWSESQPTPSGSRARIAFGRFDAEGRFLSTSRVFIGDDSPAHSDTAGSLVVVDGEYHLRWARNSVVAASASYVERLDGRGGTSRRELTRDVGQEVFDGKRYGILTYDPKTHAVAFRERVGDVLSPPVAIGKPTGSGYPNTTALIATPYGFAVIWIEKIQHWEKLYFAKITPGATQISGEQIGGGEQQPQTRPFSFVYDGCRFAIVHSQGVGGRITFRR